MKFISAKEVAKLIPDGATVGVGTFVGCDIAEEILIAMESQFLSKNTPRDLTSEMRAVASARISASGRTSCLRRQYCR